MAFWYKKLLKHFDLFRYVFSLYEHNYFIVTLTRYNIYFFLHLLIHLCRYICLLYNNCYSQLICGCFFLPDEHAFSTALQIILPVLLTITIPTVLITFRWIKSVQKLRKKLKMEYRLGDLSMDFHNDYANMDTHPLTSHYYKRYCICFYLFLQLSRIWNVRQFFSV